MKIGILILPFELVNLEALDAKDLDLNVPAELVVLPDRKDERSSGPRSSTVSGSEED
jgi:hypothetical protein